MTELVIPTYVYKIINKHNSNLHLFSNTWTKIYVYIDDIIHRVKSASMPNQMQIYYVVDVISFRHLMQINIYALGDEPKREVVVLLILKNEGVTNVIQHA